jgi:hypothetical protein
LGLRVAGRCEGSAAAVPGHRGFEGSEEIQKETKVQSAKAGPANASLQVSARFM